MKYKDLMTKTAGELEQLLVSERGKLVKLKFDLSEKKLQNAAGLRQAKLTIAHILTRLHQLNKA